MAAVSPVLFLEMLGLVSLTLVPVLPAVDDEDRFCWGLPGTLADASCSGQAVTWVPPMVACMLGRCLLPQLLAAR